MGCGGLGAGGLQREVGREKVGGSETHITDVCKGEEGERGGGERGGVERVVLRCIHVMGGGGGGAERHTEIETHRDRERR